MREDYQEQLGRIEEELHHAMLLVAFGPTFLESRVQIDGEERKCYGADVSVNGGERTNVELRISVRDEEDNFLGTAIVSGTFEELAEPIRMEGMFSVSGAEFEDPPNTIRRLAYLAKKRQHASD